MYCTVLNCIIIKLKVPYMYQILDSLVVRISACHVEGPGSIPGRGEIFSHFKTYNQELKSHKLLGGLNP